MTNVKIFLVLFTIQSLGALKSVCITHVSLPCYVAFAISMDSGYFRVCWWEHRERRELFCLISECKKFTGDYFSRLNLQIYAAVLEQSENNFILQFICRAGMLLVVA